MEEGYDMELACDHKGEGWNMCEWSREGGDLKCVTYNIAEDKGLECEAPDNARVIGSADSCKVSLGPTSLTRISVKLK